MARALVSMDAARAPGKPGLQGSVAEAPGLASAGSSPAARQPGRIGRAPSGQGAAPFRDDTKPYKFVGFGDMDVTKPYKFTGFGHMDVTKPYEFIGFGDIHGPKPYKWLHFGWL